MHIKNHEILQSVVMELYFGTFILMANQKEKKSSIK